MKKNKPSLGNPAAIAVASSPAGQKAIERATDVIPFVLKTLFVLGIGYVIYSKITNTFVPWGTKTKYPIANITDQQAQARAEAIYQGMKGFGNGFDIVAQNIAGLNYNAFVKLYNAFGKRSGIIPFSKEMDLLEWINDQFEDVELSQLRGLVNGFF